MEAIIFIGLQATGKSTFYKESFVDTHIRLNFDMLKTKRREQILLDACIESKTPFVIDRTNPTVEDRQVYIEKAKEAKFKVIGYYFQSKLEDALQRNSKRDNQSLIPERGIRGTYSKLVLPSYEEHFDELHYVEMDSRTNNFIVNEWQDEI